MQVKDYEFTITLPEGVEKADKEHPYVVTIKKNNRLPGKVTGTLSVDGILEWDENFVADSGSENEDTGLVTVTAEASYVGTSSCTIQVDAISTVGSIVTYQYKVNDKLLEETGVNNCTIQDLEPNSNYTVAVTAIDEKGNSKTVSVAIITKERMYIVKDGIQQYPDQTELINTTIAQENGYLKLAMGPTYQRCYYLVLFDVSNYTKLVLDAEVYNFEGSISAQSDLNVSSPITDWLNGSPENAVHCDLINCFGSAKVTSGRACYELALNGLSGKNYINISRNAVSHSVGATFFCLQFMVRKIKVLTSP